MIFVLIAGGERFQGVWHKFVPATGAALLPAGTYRLTALRGNSYDGSTMTIVIDGTKISGQSSGATFKGSVRERFTGSMDLNRIGETRQSGQENTVLEDLENASWFEQDGRLRVVKDGKTVLRFEPLKEAVEAK